MIYFALPSYIEFREHDMTNIHIIYTWLICILNLKKNLQTCKSKQICTKLPLSRTPCRRKTWRSRFDFVVNWKKTRMKMIKKIVSALPSTLFFANKCRGEECKWIPGCRNAEVRIFLMHGWAIIQHHTVSRSYKSGFISNPVIISNQLL